jgi:WD40 repeat protein
MNNLRRATFFSRRVRCVLFSLPPSLATRRPERVADLPDLPSPSRVLLDVASIDRSSSVDGAVRMWDTRVGTCTATRHGHAGPVLGFATSPDGALVATASDDRTSRVFKMA